MNLLNPTKPLLLLETFPNSGVATEDIQLDSQILAFEIAWVLMFGRGIPRQCQVPFRDARFIFDLFLRQFGYIELLDLRAAPQKAKCSPHTCFSGEIVRRTLEQLQCLLSDLGHSEASACLRSESLYGPAEFSITARSKQKQTKNLFELISRCVFSGAIITPFGAHYRAVYPALLGQPAKAKVPNSKVLPGNQNQSTALDNHEPCSLRAVHRAANLFIEKLYTSGMPLNVYFCRQNWYKFATNVAAKDWITVVGSRSLDAVHMKYAEIIGEALSGKCQVGFQCEDHSPSKACISKRLHAPKKLKEESPPSSFVLVSGGAPGADLTAEISDLKAGGSVIEIWPISLQSAAVQWGLSNLLRLNPQFEKNCLQVSLSIRLTKGLSESETEMERKNPRFSSPLSNRAPVYAESTFSPAQAMERNRLLYTLPRATFVIQSDFRTGGTWNGCVAALRAKISPIFVPSDGAIAHEALAFLGAIRFDYREFASLSPSLRLGFINQALPEKLS